MVPFIHTSLDIYKWIFINDRRTKLEQINTQVSRININLNTQEDAANRHRITAKQQEIVNWLKVCDPSTNHNAARNLHEPGTGSWFINSSEYIKWRDNEVQSLWLQAIPGAGKTILCSTIIDDIKEFCTSRPEYCFAYFYFDFGDRMKQTVDSFLRSIIIQLFIVYPNIS